MLVAAAFMQVVDVIILVAVNLVIVEFSGFEIIGLMGTALGLFAVCAVNSAIFWMAVASGLGMVGRDNPQLVSAGKYVAGALV